MHPVSSRTGFTTGRIPGGAACSRRGRLPSTRTSPPQRSGGVALAVPVLQAGAARDEGVQNRSSRCFVEAWSASSRSPGRVGIARCVPWILSYSILVSMTSRDTLRGVPANARRGSSVWCRTPWLIVSAAKPPVNGRSVAVPSRNCASGNRRRARERIPIEMSTPMCRLRCRGLSRACARASPHPTSMIGPSPKSSARRRVPS